MSLPPNVLEEIVSSLASEIASRVGAELEAKLSASVSTPEPWRLLDVEETAARLGRSTKTVRAWAKTGALPHIRLDGGAFAFDVDDLRAFARARRITAAEGDALAPRLQAVPDAASDAGSETRRRASNRRVSP